MALMMDFLGTLGERQREFGKMKEQDNRKDELIERLFEQITIMDNSLKDAKENLEKESDLVSYYRTQLKRYERDERQRQQVVERNSYVVVLVDGDCMPFKDDFIVDAEKGGHDAARVLKSAVNEYVRDTVNDLPSGFKIIIRVHANTKGLAKAYRDCTIVEGLSNLETFIRGFNMEDALCDYVNAGDGKECSDEKLRGMYRNRSVEGRFILMLTGIENFKLYVDDLNCKHIIFCGSGDNGYARLLTPYSGDSAVSNRITLLEGPPFAKELAELRDKFAVTSFPTVFRQTKLQPRKVSTGGITPPVIPVPNYASAVARNPVSTLYSVITADSVSQEDAVTQPVLLRNSKGQRIDPVLRVSTADMASLKNRKYCNFHHLSGGCYHGEDCSHTHGPRLTGKMLDALRQLARLSPCAQGLDCIDPGCNYGHQCSRPYCNYTCRFTKEMHGIDTKVF